MLRTIQYIPGAVYGQRMKKRKRKRKDPHKKEIRYYLLILGKDIREKKTRYLISFLKQSFIVWWYSFRLFSHTLQ